MTTIRPGCFDVTSSVMTSTRRRSAGGQRWAMGALLDRAEEAGYEVVITADKNIPHQQNLGRRNLALIVLGANRWPLIEPRMEDIRNALEGIQPGEVKEVPIPMRGEG